MQRDASSTGSRWNAASIWRLHLLVGRALLAFLERLPHAEDRRHARARAPRAASWRRSRRSRRTARAAPSGPTITYFTLSLASISGLTSPVYAPWLSQWQFCAPSPILSRSPSMVVCTERNAVNGRAHDDVDAVVVLGVEAEPELLHHLDRLQMRVVHLPVARHHRLAIAHRRVPLRKACSPGRSPSSMSSSDAPPPVDTWSMRSASPKWRTADALSPPPIDGEAAAIGDRFGNRARCRPRTARARTRPSGRSTAPSPRPRSRRRSGPRSRARCRGPSARRGSRRRARGASARRPSCRPRRRRRSGSRCGPSSAARGSARPGRPARASRRRCAPCAARNVNAIAPPMSSVSQRSSSASSTPSLSLTFTPPRIATNGRFGASSSPPSTSTSRASSRPAADGHARSGGPTIDACGAVRGAERVVDVDVAELARGSRRTPGSFASSPGSKRRFSISMTSPGSRLCDRRSDSKPATSGERPHLDAEQLAQPARDRRERVLRVDLALRPSEVRAAHDLGAAVAEVLDRRQRGGDAQVVVDARRRAAGR